MWRRAVRRRVVETPWGWGVLAKRKSTGSSRAPGSNPHRPHGAQKGL